MIRPHPFIAALGVALALHQSPAVVASDGDSDLIGKRAPDLAEGEWLNTPPLTLERLRGNVILLEFWTFACSNCLHTLPSMKAWHQAYKDKHLVVLGVHTPEFDLEKDSGRLHRKVTELGITYPVVADNASRTWSRYHQRYWPAMYLIDKRGVVRFCHIGEGNDALIERELRLLLAE